LSTYDVIVIGLGSMGGAAARQLAARGRSVLGLESFGPAHNRGSAHGGSRIVRQSYFEGEAYVPLLQRAYQGWRELEADSGRELLTLCGGLYLGDPESLVFAGARRSAETHGLDHQLLDADQIVKRFPTMRPAEQAVGLYEDNAGFTRPEQTVLANLTVARRSGAELRFEEPARSWTATPGGGVEVVTARGRYSAAALVISPGAWAPQLLRDYELALTIQRQVVYWLTPEFTPDVPYERYTSAEHPVFIEETDHNRELYGFPMIDGPTGGMKVAFFDTGETTTPETIDREIHPAEVDRVRTRGLQLFPRLTGPLVAASTCMYSTTPDHHFIIGTLPDLPQVAIACGFSGHGFKFVPVVGEILADLVTDGSTPHDLSLFRLDRDGIRAPWSSRGSENG
jgi:sarcosine oxidase